MQLPHTLWILQKRAVPGKLQLITSTFYAGDEELGHAVDIAADAVHQGQYDGQHTCALPIHRMGLLRVIWVSFYTVFIIYVTSGTFSEQKLISNLAGLSKVSVHTQYAY